MTSGGEQAGPVNIDELRYLYNTKATHGQCLCWNESMDGWTLIKDVALLTAYFNPKQLPPPLPKAPTISLALPPLSAAEVSPAPSAASAVPDPRRASLLKEKSKVGVVAAQHAKYKTAMKKDRGSTKGLDQKKYGTMRLSKAAAAAASSPDATNPRTSDASQPTPTTTPSPLTSSSADPVTPPVPEPSATPLPPAGTYSADEISAQLTSAIRALDAEGLTHWLAVGDAANLDENRYLASPLARMYLSKLQSLQQRMREAVTSMDEDDLCAAVYYAESIGYDRPDVASCRVLRDAVVQLNHEARQQALIIDERKMKALLARSEQLSLSSPPIEHLRTLTQHTSEEKLRQLQLKAANALGDKHRATRLTIALKELVFKKTGHLFTLESYGRWRDPDEWASEKMALGGKAALMEGMRRWSKEPIHASLTRLTKEQSKAACKAFKRVLTYCGDRGSEPSQTYDVARELLELGLKEVLMRDELYVQLIKQLTLNPSTDSEKAAWRLMYACLDTFPPCAEMENVLEMWLSKHLIQGTAAVTMLHQTVYDGERRFVPSDSELAVICTGRSLRSCGYLEEREYHTAKAVMPDVAGVQTLAGTTAEGIEDFLRSGRVPDWTDTEVRMPHKEAWKQPEPRCDVKKGRSTGTSITVQQGSAHGSRTGTQPPTPRAPQGSEALVTGAAAPPPVPVVVMAPPPVRTVLVMPPPVPSSFLPPPVPQALPSSAASLDAHMPPPMLSVVAPVSPVSALSASIAATLSPLSPMSPSYAAFTTPPTFSPTAVSSPPPLLSSPSLPPPEPITSPARVLSPPPPPPAAVVVPERVRLWGKAEDPSTGQFYFYHLETHEVTWDQPEAYFD